MITYLLSLLGYTRATAIAPSRERYMRATLSASEKAAYRWCNGTKRW